MLENVDQAVISDEICNLALSLHNQKNTELSISRSARSASNESAIQNSIWTEDGDQLRFSSLAARNYCAALAIYRDLKEKKVEKEADALFSAAHDLSRNELGNADLACVRFLSLASEHTNILLAAATLIEAGQHRVWDVLRLVQVAMPYLKKIEASDLIAIVTVQHPKTTGDTARGLLFNAIEDRLVHEPSLAWDLYNALKRDLNESTSNLYCAALYALTAKSQQAEALHKAREDAHSQKPLVASAALWVLGRALSARSLPANLAQQCQSTLVEMLTDAQEEIRQSAMRAVAQAAATQHSLIEDLLRVAESGNQYPLLVLADFVSMNHEVLKEHESLPKILRTLIGLEPESSEGIQNFDWVLHSIFAEEKYRELVMECLTEWTIRHGSTKLRDTDLIELFNQTISSVANDAPRLAKLITNWLLADQQQLAGACGGLINALWVRGFKQPIFSKEILDRASDADLKFLARRMLGYVISEEPLLSMTFSLLNTDDAPRRTFGLIHALLVQEVGRDYIRTTLEAISEKLQIQLPEEIALLKSAHAKLSAYAKNIEELPRLQELRPPAQLRRMIALKRSRQMRESMDAATEKSIFRQISTQVPLKAGTGWFSVTKSGVSETHRLQSISHQVSLPRRALVDPVGYAITGLGYRIAKRGDE